VFRARDRFRAMLPEEHQDVALKILPAGEACAEQTIAHLRLEFHCAQLLSHRNIVNVHELDRDGDIVFFTMELLEGETLRSVLESLRPAAMGRARAWQLIHQLGAGLMHAHERGVVHGDLKPQNIFITREGELRILDFGAAHRVTTVKPQSERGSYAPTSGTPAYASCEQLEGRRADRRDDLYALACICYELLAGTHPFDSRPATLARDYRVSLIRPPGLTGRQWRALKQGLSWHRAARSVSVRSWMQRLVHEKAREHPLTPLQELTQPDKSPPRIAWRAAALVLVASLSSAAILSQLKSTSETETPEARSAALKVAQNKEIAGKRIGEPAADDHVTSAPTGVATSAPAGGVTSAPTDRDTPVPTDGAAPPDVHAAKDIPENALEPRPAPRVPQISVAPSKVRSDDHFAEIRLHRNALQKDDSFTWWTEPATAKPGIDYVPETVAMQRFPAGYRATRLYIRLLPQSLRSHRSYFYIALARLGAHDTRGMVTRRQIWLPATSNLQARR